MSHGHRHRMVERPLLWTVLPCLAVLCWVVLPVAAVEVTSFADLVVALKTPAPTVQITASFDFDFQINITTEVAITGACTPSPCVITGKNKTRLFEVQPSAILRVSNFVFTECLVYSILSDPNSGRGSVLYVRDLGSLESSNNQFLRNFAGVVQNTDWNYASGGGTVALEGASTLLSTNDTFSENVGALGAGINVQGNGTYIIKDGTFERNIAIKDGGALELSRGASVSTSGCLFENNTANNGGGVSLDLGSSWNSTSDIFFGQVSKNLGTLSVMAQSRANFIGVVFDSNLCKLGGAAMYVQGQSNVTSVNGRYVGNKASVLGGVLRVQGDSIFLSTNDSFLNNSSPQGGALSVQGASFLGTDLTCIGNSADIIGGCVEVSSPGFNCTKCIISYNSAGQKGGGITVGAQGQVFLWNSTVSANKAKGVGGGLHVETGSAVTNGTLWVQNGAPSGGGMYINIGSNVTVVGDTFDGNVAERADGGAVYVADKSRFVSKTCTFLNNTATRGGGAVYVIDLETKWESSGCTYTSNQAVAGGAAYVEADADLVVSTDDAFLKNNASNGGGVYSATGFVANSSVIGTEGGQCLFEQNTAVNGAGMYCGCSESRGSCCVVRGCRFVRNVAKLGGAGVWSDQSVNLTCTEGAPTNTPSCSYWSDNTALYGSGIATNAEYVSASVTQVDSRPGQPLGAIEVTLRDKYSQIVKTGTLSEVVLCGVVGSTAQIAGVANLPIDGSTGIAAFRDLTLRGPSGTYTLNFSSPTTPKATPCNVTVNLTDCSIGTVANSRDKTCTLCVGPAYSWNVAAPSCDLCPEGAECNATGAVVVPSPGFYHDGIFNKQFHPCRIESACNYGNRTNVLQSLLTSIVDTTTTPDLWQSYQQCSPRYRGRLCAACTDGYGLDTSQHCVKCPRKSVQALLSVLVVVITIGAAGVLTIFAIKSNEEHAVERGDPAEVMRKLQARGGSVGGILKIGLSYLQIISSAYIGRFRWPFAVRYLLSTTSTVTSVSSPIVPLACFFNNTHMRASFKTILLATLAPLLAFIVPLLVIGCLYLYESHVHRRRSKHFISLSSLPSDLSTRSSPSMVTGPIKDHDGPSPALNPFDESQPRSANDDGHWPGMSPTARNKPRGRTSDGLSISNKRSLAPGSSSYLTMDRGTFDGHQRRYQRLMPEGVDQDADGGLDQLTSHGVRQLASEDVSSEEQGGARPPDIPSGSTSSAPFSSCVSADVPSFLPSSRLPRDPALQPGQPRISATHVQSIPALGHVPNPHPKSTLDPATQTPGPSDGQIPSVNDKIPPSNGQASPVPPASSDGASLNPSSHAMATPPGRTSSFPLSRTNSADYNATAGRGIGAVDLEGPPPGCMGGTPGKFKDFLTMRYLTGCMAILFLLYPGVCNAIVSLWSCAVVWTGTLGETAAKYWWQDIDLECFKGQHLGFVMVIGVGGLVVFVVGIPVLSAAVLVRNRARLGESSMLARLGFLYEEYSDRLYYWESVYLVQKLCFVIVQTFVESPFIQLLSVLTLTGFFLETHRRLTPYRWPLLNHLQEGAWYCLFLVNLFGLFFAARPTPLCGIIVSTSIFVLNLAFLTYLLVQLYRVYKIQYAPIVRQFIGSVKERITGSRSSSRKPLIVEIIPEETAF